MTVASYSAYRYAREVELYTKVSRFKHVTTHNPYILVKMFLHLYCIYVPYLSSCKTAMLKDIGMIMLEKKRSMQAEPGVMACNNNNYRCRDTLLIGASVSEPLP